MKHLSTAIVLVLGGALSASAYGADRLRAHYEINVQEGTDLKVVQTTSEVTSGTPIEFDLTKYRLSLLIDVGQSDTYVLTVSLAPVASPKDVFARGTFNGRLVAANVGPLEFNLEQHGVKVTGAIALSAIRQ